MKNQKPRPVTRLFQATESEIIDLAAQPGLAAQIEKLKQGNATIRTAIQDNGDAFAKRFTEDQAAIAEAHPSRRIAVRD